MQHTFQLSILAMDHPFFEGECVSMDFPTTDGQYGIKANHSNIVAAVVEGELHFKEPDGTLHIAAVSEGMIKVESNKVLILVGTIERPDEIDEKIAQRDLEEAREALINKRSIYEYNAAQAKMARTFNRLKTKRHKRF